MKILSDWWRNRKAYSQMLSGTAHSLKGEFEAGIMELTEAINTNPRLF